MAPGLAGTGTAYEMIAQLYNPALAAGRRPWRSRRRATVPARFSGYLSYAINGNDAAVGWAQALPEALISYRVARYVNGTWQAPVTPWQASRTDVLQPSHAGRRSER